jgi:putative DNA primase/helicase
MSTEQLRQAATGRWPEILQSAGIGGEYLKNQHGPCPACGGKDRFRFDDIEGRGTFICTQSGAGDGFKLLELYLKTDFEGAARFVEGYLGIQPTKTAKAYWKTPQDAISAWPQLTPAVSHPYLKRKGIQAHGARINGDELVIPVCSDLAGTVVSVQKILPAKKGGKDKFFIKGTEKKGNFFLIGGDLIDLETGAEWCEIPAVFEGGPALPARVLLFCEGFATGATLHESTGLPVVVCFDADNVPPVAKKLRTELTDAIFIYCTDADIKGREAAKKAVKAAIGMGCIPEFEPGQEGTDFNDLAIASGADAVKKRVDAALQEARTWMESTGKPGAGGEGEKPQFKIEGGKLYKLRTIKNALGKEEEKPSCVGGAIEVKAGTVDARGGNHGRLLEFRVGYDKTRTWVMPMELLAGESSKILGVLLSRGYWCAAPHQKFARDAVAEYINSIRPEETLTTTEQTGWHGRVFVLTGGEIIGQGDKVIFTGADTDIYQARGNLADWRRELAALAVGNSRLEFALSLAFAGPLMPLTGDDGAGCNFYGTTSTGKSTTQIVAASVWGSPEPGGFISKWNATSTGLEIQAVQRNHTLFCIDELGEVDPKIAGRLIYQLASGVQKGRGKADAGGVGFADPKTWRMPFISSAEKTLQQHVEDAGQRLYGGQAVRCVDIPADAGAGFGVFEHLHGQLEKCGGQADAAGAAFADLLKEQAKAHHGTAGRAFVAALLKMGTEAARGFIAEQRSAWAKANMPADAGGVARRAAKLFSLAAAAGELATALGVLPWAAGAASQAAARCFRDWLAENGAGNPEERAALAQIRHFIESRWNDFRGWDEAETGPDARNIPRQVGYVSADSEVVYIMPSIFEKDACKGYRPDFVIKLLKARDALECSPRRNVKEIRRTACRYAYTVQVEKLSAESGESAESDKKFNDNNILTIPHLLPTSSAQQNFSAPFRTEKNECGKPEASSGAGFPTFRTFRTEKHGLTDSLWQVFRDGEPAYPPRENVELARDDAAVAAGHRSWRAMKSARAALPRGLEIREVAQ